MAARESDIQRVWSGVLEAERHYRYYDSLKGRIGLIHGFIMFLIMVCSMGAVVSLLTRAPSELSTALPAVVAVASVVLFVTNYGNKAVTARIVAHQYANLAAEWKRLWREINEWPSEIISSRASVLERMQTVVDGHADQCGGTDSRLNVKVTTDPYRVVVDELSREGREG